jgi:N6-adenosine-specific RNA methylase IME4
MTFWAGLQAPYSTIVADPPWRYARPSATKADATRLYATMDLATIEAMPVAEIAATDCHLWLWGTNALMEEAHRVVRAWGFRPLTIVTWCKLGKPGVGHYLRNTTEHAILASRGAAMTPANKPISTWFQWPRCGRHSVKPGGFYDLVERVSPGPFVELFARQPRLGWDSWGHGYEDSAA